MLWVCKLLLNKVLCPGEFVIDSLLRLKDSKQTEKPVLLPFRLATLGTTKANVASCALGNGTWINGTYPPPKVRYFQQPARVRIVKRCWLER